MQATILPIIKADELSLDDYFCLRDLAYGCSSHPPEGGFSFIVSVEYIRTAAEDVKAKFLIDLHEKFKEYPFVLVKCAGDEFLLQDI